MIKQLNSKVDTGGTNPPLVRTVFLQGRRSSRPTARNPKFEGRCDDLKGYVLE